MQKAFARSQGLWGELEISLIERLTKKEQYRASHFQALRDWREKANFRQGRILRSKEENDRVLNHQCAECGVSLLPNKRKVYCSDECRENYWVKHDWSWLRSKVLKKVNYTCSKCGFRPEIDKHGYSFYHKARELVVDHVIPIALGGEEFDEKNLQVLCFKCDKEKTRIDKKKIAKAKRGFQQITYLNPFESETAVFWKRLVDERGQKPLDKFCINGNGIGKPIKEDYTW